jgi:hypothetical protein
MTAARLRCCRCGSARRSRSCAPDVVRAALAAVLHDAGAVVPPIRVAAVDALEREPGTAAKLKLIVDLR